MAPEVSQLPRLHRLMIYCPEDTYDPGFKPVNGKLQGSFNGMLLTLGIQGIDIHCCVSSHEGNICIDNQQVEPGGMTWEELWMEVINQVLLKVTMIAINQLTYLKSTESFYVN